MNSSFHQPRNPMEPPTTSASTDDSLDSFFMSLAKGPAKKTIETGLLRSSWDAAKIMQDGNPKLFAKGSEVHVNWVLYGIEPKNKDSCKQQEEKEEKKKSKFLHRFEVKEKGCGDEEVARKIKAFTWHKALKEGTYKIDLEEISRMYDREEKDLVHTQK